MLGGMRQKRRIKQKLKYKDQRFFFTPFWKITRWGILRNCYGLSGDYWHNKSHYIIIPLIGCFELFGPLRYLRFSDSEHASAWIDGELTEGVFYPKCDLCIEFKEMVEEACDQIKSPITNC